MMLLPMLLLPLLLLASFGVIFFHPNSDCANMGQAPSYTPADTSLHQTCGAWVVVGSAQYSVWDYRLGPPTNLLRQQLVTYSSNGDFVFDSYTAARVLTMRLVLTSAQIVDQSYSAISQATAIGKIASSVSSLLNGVQLPDSVSSSFQDLQGLLQDGSNAAAPIAAVVLSSATQASAMANTRTETSAEAFLESLVVGGAAGAAGNRAVLVLFIVEAAVQLDVQIGNWVNVLYAQLVGSTPMLDALQTTYGPVVQ
jgi:hypothetical protein